MPNTFKTRLKNLSLMKKIILFGSIITFIGVFLPWYKDIDQFKTGDMFLGITGPLYLSGLIVLLASIVTIGLIGFKLFDKPIPKLPIKEDHLYILSSSLSLFMLILTISVFFHHKFGINLIDKSVGIGMMLAFIGSGLVLLGAILSIKKGAVDFEGEGYLEPLINLEEKERNKQGLESKEERVYDDDSLKVKNAIQESLDDFTETKNDTNDIN